MDDLNWDMFEDRVLLEKIEEKVEEKVSDGGIVIPNQVTEKSLKNKHLFFGIVKRVGWATKHSSIGDTVIFNITNTQQVELDGKEYYIIEEKNILARKITE